MFARLRRSTRVALSMRVVQAPDYHESRDAISHDWVRRLSELGVVPVLIPNTIQDHGAYLERMSVDAVLLTGGDDLRVDAYRTDQLDQEEDRQSVRERTESALLDYAVKERLPVLGNCRGMQAINVYFGGGLESRMQNAAAHLATQHIVELCDADVAAFLNTKRFMVNSFHRSGILSQQLSSELRAFARAPFDDSVEGFYHPNLPIIGVLWHPERPHQARDYDTQLMGMLWRHREPWFRFQTNHKQPSGRFSLGDSPAPAREMGLAREGA